MVKLISPDLLPGKPETEQQIIKQLEAFGLEVNEESIKIAKLLNSLYKKYQQNDEFCS